MTLQLVANNKTPQPEQPKPWECPDCGCHSVTNTMTGLLQKAGQLLFEPEVVVTADQLYCAACSTQVAHQVEGQGWMLLKKKPQQCQG